MTRCLRGLSNLLSWKDWIFTRLSNGKRELRRVKNLRQLIEFARHVDYQQGENQGNYIVIQGKKDILP